jgi:hypothetical protein
MSSNVTGQTLIREAGGVQPLMLLLRASNEDERVRVLALETLSSLARENAESLEAVMSQGLVAYVRVAVRTHAHMPPV